MAVLEGLQPRKVFEFFEELSAVPRASHNRGPVSEYCLNFARQRNLECWRDEACNVIIKKPASPGYEDSAPVILQGHLDMVAEKTADCPLDFAKDGLCLQVDGDWISARGTTLGADNGIAVAMALAVLDDKSLCHPPVEVLFTTDEEVGMLGASEAELSPLQGRRLLNLDSEDEGVFTAGCAGGVRADCRIPLEKEQVTATLVQITVSGVTGGHSGVAIHKGGANACILLGRVLKGLNTRLVSASGGGKDNVIPRQAEACVAVEGEAETLLRQVREREAVLQKEYVSTDPELCVKAKVLGEARTALTETSTQKCVDFLTLSPNGVMVMSPYFKGLVQTSLNLGVLTCGEEFSAGFSLRSSLASQKNMLVEKLEALTRLLGGTMKLSGEYPAWEYREQSPLRETAVAVYRELYGKTPEVNVVHGGLECGILAEKLPGLDVISYGPDIPQIHTVQEKMSVSSVARVWDFTLELLKRLK